MSYQQFHQLLLKVLLNYDKYFKDGDAKRNTLTEFISNNTRLLNLEETKETIAKLDYIQQRMAEE